MRNLVASIQTKLKNIAQKEQKTHHLILVRYFSERLIYRMSLSPYKDNFCLKGGTLLYALEKDKSRPTMDIDFLGMNISNDLACVKAVFTEISQIAYELDAVQFVESSIATSEITKEGTYSGVRVKMEARLGNIKQNLQIDIGFGDVVTPPPLVMDYPTLLEMAYPSILAYSAETVIAEKFEAMIDLADQNSRMKDFYDIYRLLNKGNIQQKVLEEAIFNTFQRRGTPFIENHVLFSKDFATNEKRLIQWKAFLTKMNLHMTIEQNMDFQKVLAVIQQKLYPIFFQLKNER